MLVCICDCDVRVCQRENGVSLREIGFAVSSLRTNVNKLRTAENLNLLLRKRCLIHLFAFSSAYSCLAIGNVQQIFAE